MENAEYLVLRGIPIINTYNENGFLDRVLCVNDEVIFVQNAKWNRFDPEWVFFVSWKFFLTKFYADGRTTRECYDVVIVTYVGECEKSVHIVHYKSE